MAILSRLLQVLELLEQAREFAQSLTTRQSLALVACLLSYEVLLLGGCDSPSAAVLASAIALALHCGLHHPDL